MSQVDDLVRRELAVFARATDWPRSKTSGARSVPFSWSAALISSWLAASGWAEFDLDAVLRAEGLDDLAVVGPVRRQRDDVERALLLGRGDERVHPAEPPARRSRWRHRWRRCRTRCSAAPAGRSPRRPGRAPPGRRRRWWCGFCSRVPLGRAGAGCVHVDTPAGHRVARRGASRRRGAPAGSGVHRLVARWWARSPGLSGPGGPRRPGERCSPGSGRASGTRRRRRVRPPGRRPAAAAPLRAARRGAGGPAR